MKRIIEDTTATILMTIAAAVIIFGLASYSNNKCADSQKSNADYIYCIGL